jgi:carboxymethylenebutenolidase
VQRVNCQGTPKRVNPFTSRTFPAYTALPKTGSGPGILVIQEIFGINPFIRATCDYYASLGYLAVAPDLFWRLQPGIQLDPEKPDEFQQALGLMGRFDADKAVADMTATITAMRRHEACTGKVGTIGYCLGGKLAYLMATRSDADANAAYYGVGLDQLLGEAKNITAPLILHIAEEDGFVPKQAQAAIRAGLAGNPHVTIYSYAGADHAFAREGGSHYKADAARLANERTLKLFTETLET